MNNRKKISTNYLAFLAFVIIALPIDFFGIRLLNEAILPVSFLGAAIYLSHANMELGKIEKNVLFTSFVFSIFFISILILNMPSDVALKDFIEPVKPIIYGLIFLSGRRSAQHLNDNFVVSWFVRLAVLSVIISCSIYFPFLNEVTDLYKGRRSTEEFNIHFYRFSGTLAYPGPFGYWLVLALLFSLEFFRIKLASYKSFIATFIILFLGIILTGSRAALIILLLSLSFYYFWNIKSKRILSFYAISLLLTGLITIPVILMSNINLTESYSQINYLIEGISNPTESSFAHRSNELAELLARMESGIYLGSGPDNINLSNNHGPIETVYYYYGYKFGIVGIFYYVLIAFLSFHLFFISKTAENPAARIFYMWSLIALTIGAASESVTEEYKSFYIFFVLTGFFSHIKPETRKTCYSSPHQPGVSNVFSRF